MYNVYLQKSLQLEIYHNCNGNKFKIVILNGDDF